MHHEMRIPDALCISFEGVRFPKPQVPDVDAPARDNGPVWHGILLVTTVKEGTKLTTISTVDIMPETDSALEDASAGPPNLKSHVSSFKFVLR